MKLRTLFYVQPIAYVLLEIVLGYTFWLLLIFIFRERKFNRIIVTAAFIGACAVICTFTLYRQRLPFTEISLVPLHSFVEVIYQPEKYRELLMNVALFIPLGLSLPFVLPDRVRHKVVWAVLIGMVLSICIEASQYIFALGRCETDDVIMNTLGTLIGASSYPLYRLLLSWIEKKKRGKISETYNESRK